MSDIEASPSKDNGTLNIEDYNYQEREPKCINSLCNLINSRLKVLESEILAQHKVWESIQKEVDEVKSLIEDCTSTCGSSSSSAQENESENVDSALESHKTCNSLLWGKLKQAEENLEEKKHIMQILSNDVTRLRNSKKRCGRRHARSKSNVDLILEVTNGLHVLKCDDCKFCREHLDFREGLLSAVIELIHFTEKNYNHSLEENKTLKSCLQKIYIKTKSCLLHSQIYLKNTQHHPTFDTENQLVGVDNIYTSFEEFCQHFQTLQDELFQLRQILHAAEENQLDELFQDPHSVHCICYNFMKKGDPQSSNNSEKNEAKFSKSSQKGASSYEKKLKSLPYGTENDEDPDGIFDADQIFKFSESEPSKQLETLRNRIYEAVRTIRDVEVEENDDGNLVRMVASLAEECSALRQEVSYLRNVRQEKKRAWNKLQCFIMDAERNLKGNRTVPGVKEVIRDLGQIISSRESSSLDETILYMYSNQLEWMEKLSTVKEGSLEEEVTRGTADSLKTVSTQTLLFPEKMMKDYYSGFESQRCDIGIQVEGVFEYFTTETSKPYGSSFSEINREIYVVPEGVEETDSCYSSYSVDPKDGNTLEESSSKHSSQDTTKPELSESVTPSFESESDLSEDTFKSVVTVSNLSGKFSDDTNYEVVPTKSTKRFSLPLLDMSDVPFTSTKSEFWKNFPDSNILFNNPLDNSIYICMFMNQNLDFSHKFNSMFYNLMGGGMGSADLPDQGKSWSCIILQSSDSPLTLNSSNASVKYLPYQPSSVSVEDDEGDTTCVGTETKYHRHAVTPSSEVICREIIFKPSDSDSTVPSSSLSDGQVLPNTSSSDFKEDDGAIHSSEPPLSEAAIEDVESQIIPENDGEESAARGRRPPGREGTFIVDSSDSLRLSKQHIFNDNMYYTAILTTLVSSCVNTAEKSYVLFEVCKSFKQSNVQEFQGDHLPESVPQEKHNVQHFVLCETGEDDASQGHQVVSDICHIIFCKSNANLENKHLFDISSGNNTSFSPLVPQYFPLETFSYDSFEPLSLTHNCEIYMCNTKREPKLNSEDESSALVPKNFLKFKTFLTSKEAPQYGTLDESVQKHYLTNEYAIPFHLSGAEMTATSGGESSVIEDASGRISTGSQTDASDDAVLHESTQENLAEDAETPAAETGASAETESEQRVETENEDFMFSTTGPEHTTSEISLLDEIRALKENLGHQNAVLQRLKEELEDSNMKLERKESQLQILQVEHSRLNEIMVQNNIKEVEDKKCQTDLSSDSEKYEKLKKEVHNLRQENIQHHDKIINQNKTIQHVKAQLCASISHLKTLKDSATKELKKQKQHILKSLKVRQQLQDTKLSLEKKSAEIEKKNEIISDQEFQIHEMQARLDSTVEELSKKMKELEPKPEVTIKIDNTCQTQFLEGERRGEEKRLKPVTEQDVILRKHSEELQELHNKLQQLESVLSNKNDYYREPSEDYVTKSSHELKVPTHLKEGNIWKLLMISEQSYLSLLSKLSESLQLSDLKGTVTLMHSSWLNCDDLADARRQDHKKILQSLDTLKRSIRYLQETHHQEQRRQNAEGDDLRRRDYIEEKKAGLLCHSDEMHFQYLCEVLQRAQENLVKEYSEKKAALQRSVVSTGSLRTTRHANSRERRIPLELKNGKILALLDDGLNQSSTRSFRSRSKQRPGNAYKDHATNTS